MGTLASGDQAELAIAVGRFVERMRPLRTEKEQVADTRRARRERELGEKCPLTLSDTAGGVCGLITMRSWHSGVIVPSD